MVRFYLNTVLEIVLLRHRGFVFCLLLWLSNALVV